MDEFQFASYIMQNAKYLHTMKICIANHPDKSPFDLMSQLISCTKSSDTFTLSFEYLTVTKFLLVNI